jgi:hypothetical protein
LLIRNSANFFSQTATYHDAARATKWMTCGWGWGDGTVALRGTVCYKADVAASVRVSLQWYVDYGASQRFAKWWDPAVAGIRTDGIEVAKGHFRVLQCIRALVYLTTPSTARIIWCQMLDWLENEESESQSTLNVTGSLIPWSNNVDFLKILFIAEHCQQFFKI